MTLRFALNGRTVFQAKGNHVPPVGSEVSFRLDNPCEDFDAGTKVGAVVLGGEIAPAYDYTDGDEVTVHISVGELRALAYQG